MKIVLASPIYETAIEKLEKRHQVIRAYGYSEEKLIEVVHEAEVIILRSGVSITKKLIDNSPKLNLLIRAGSGTDNIDLDYLKQRKIKLIRIPMPGARAVAEMSFALMLCLSRDIIKADNLTKKGIWAKNELSGVGLYGKKIGIVGSGTIGTLVGKMAKAWGMKVYGCVERPNGRSQKRLKRAGITQISLDKILKNSDFISIHVPLQESTQNLIDKRALSLMNSNTILINLSRGGVVNEKDLLDALNKKQIKAVALDVHEFEGGGFISPMASLSNVILTPHIGAQTQDVSSTPFVRPIGEIEFGVNSIVA